MTTLRTWLAAARPRTLPAAVVPVAVGDVAWLPALGGAPNRDATSCPASRRPVT